MSHMTLRILIICLVLAGPAEVLSAPAAHDTVAARDYKAHGRPIHRLAQNGRFTLDQAVDKVRARYGGKIIKASTRRQKGRPVHIIKILGDNGRVHTVRVDGISGQIL
ncbi:MAG: PepSY domain-containing protein [Gammaproteobacteria bacterium]